MCSKQYAAQLEPMAPLPEKRWRRCGAAQVDPMAPLPEKDGGAVAPHSGSASRTARGRPCSLHLSSSVEASHVIPGSLPDVSAQSGSVLKKLPCAAKRIIEEDYNRQGRQGGRQRDVGQVTIHHLTKTREISAEGCRVC